MRMKSLRWAGAYHRRSSTPLFKGCPTMARSGRMQNNVTKAAEGMPLLNRERCTYLG